MGRGFKSLHVHHQKKKQDVTLLVTSCLSAINKTVSVIENYLTRPIIINDSKNFCIIV